MRPSGPIQARIRAVNAANGWTVPGDLADRTSIVACLALVVTEVAEAIEVVRAPPVDRDHLAEELADVVIRLLDLGSGFGIEVLGPEATTGGVPGAFDVATTGGLVAALGVVAATVGRLLDRFIACAPGDPPSREMVAAGLAEACGQVEALAGVLGLDLPAAIEGKVARNAARGLRHGGRAI